MSLHTANTSQILPTTRARRTVAPTRPNQRLAISADGTITTHTKTLESGLRTMFARLGAARSNERRNARFANPIMYRTITIRNNDDIRRLERRILTRSRFNAARARTPPGQERREQARSYGEMVSSSGADTRATQGRARACAEALRRLRNEGLGRAMQRYYRSQASPSPICSRAPSTILDRIPNGRAAATRA